MHNTQKTQNNKKLKILLTLGIIAILAVCAIIISTRADSAYAFWDNDITFFAVRSGTAVNVAGNNNDQRARNFACFDFQSDHTNFRYIPGANIAILSDDAHNRTLWHQSNEIRNAAQNGNTGGSLTVFVHGQGGRAADWSNCGGNGGTAATFRQLRYRNYSMIEEMRRYTNANVYVARSHIFQLRYQTEYYGQGGYRGNTMTRHHVYRENRNLMYLFGQNVLGQPLLHNVYNQWTTPRTFARPLISLFPLGNNWGSYYEVNLALRRNIAYTGLRHTTPRSLNPNFPQYDYTRNNILIFESLDAIQYRNFVYNELNAILTKISYDYLQATGMVPLVNFITHSTGGVWGMMWANNHPHNTGAIHAIAAPFNGSGIGAAVRRDWVNYNTLPTMDMINNPSSFDNTDNFQRDILRTGWASAVATNPNLRLYATAGVSDVGFLMGGGFWAAAILSAAASLLPSSGPINPVIVAVIVSMIMNSIPGLDGLTSTVTNLILSLEQVGPLAMFWSDGAIHMSSAHAVGFANPAGQIRTNTRGFFSIYNNYNRNLLAHPELGHSVPHNLLTKDNVANTGVRNRFFSLIYTIENNQVTIRGIRGLGISNLIIPETLSGFPVRTISISAFAGSSVTSIHIPSTVTTIWNGAFRDTPNLASINVAAGNTHYFSQNGILYRKTDPIWFVHIPARLSGDIVIPEGIQSLPTNAFANRNFITSIHIPASLWSVGLNTFMGTSSLERITVADGNNYYMIIDGVLYKRGTHQNHFEHIPARLVRRVSLDRMTNIYNHHHNTSHFRFTAQQEGYYTITVFRYYLYSNFNLVDFTVFLRAGQTHDFYLQYNRDGQVITQLIISRMEGRYILHTENRGLGYGETLTGFTPLSNFDGRITITRVQTIAAYAFAGNTNINYVNIIGGMAIRIQRNAFAHTRIREITIPTNVTIDTNAFLGANLLTINASDRSRPGRWHVDWNPSRRPVRWGFWDSHGAQMYFISSNYKTFFRYTGTRTVLTIHRSVSFGFVPSSFPVFFDSFSVPHNQSNFIVYVTSISPNAFAYNTSLTTIHIPDTIRQIGNNAFRRVESLRSIYIDSQVPPVINSTTFYGLNRANITVNIPAGTYQAYRNAGWTGFNLREQLPPQDEGFWLWVFDMELYSTYHLRYVGTSIQLKIQLRRESGHTEYIWVYLNAGESQEGSFHCCAVFYIEFDGYHIGIAVYGSWRFKSYATVYRWVEPPSPQPEPIEWGRVYSGWLCCWRDVNMGQNDGTIRLVFYMCCCTSSEAYAEIIIPFETSEYFTFDIGGCLHVTVLVHYGSWNLHLSLGIGVTIGFSVYRQV